MRDRLPRPEAGVDRGEQDRAARQAAWDEFVALRPEVVRRTLPMVPWDIYKLWALDLPVRRLAVEELAWLLELPLWRKDGIRFRVSPAQVRAEPNRFGGHMRRVMASDLAYPIHLVGHKSRLVVLDGYHRLLKATIEGRREIEAMVLSQRDFDSICGSYARANPHRAARKASLRHTGLSAGPERRPARDDGGGSRGAPDQSGIAVSQAHGGARGAQGVS